MSPSHHEAADRGALGGGDPVGAAQVVGVVEESGFVVVALRLVFDEQAPEVDVVFKQRVGAEAGPESLDDTVA